MKIIQTPIKLHSDWKNWEWIVETAFSLVGNRCVYKSLYEEYEVESFDQALNNLTKNRETLVHYLFKAKNVLPAFRLYAEADLYSNRCRYKEKEIVQGDTPFDFYLDDTVFEIWNEPRSTYSFSSYIRLRCGGINRENAKNNWVIVSNFCRNYFN